MSIEQDGSLSRRTTRRTVVRTGVKLAYAAPLIAASLKLGANASAAVSGSPVLSRACQDFADSPAQTIPTTQASLTYSFLAGEVISVATSNPGNGATGVRIRVGTDIVAGPEPFGTTLTYEIPADGTYTIYFEPVGAPDATAVMVISCSRP